MTRVQLFCKLSLTHKLQYYPEVSLPKTRSEHVPKCVPVAFSSKWNTYQNALLATSDDWSVIIIYIRYTSLQFRKFPCYTEFFWTIGSAFKTYPQFFLERVRDAFETQMERERYFWAVRYLNYGKVFWWITFIYMWSNITPDNFWKKNSCVFDNKHM